MPSTRSLISDKARFFNQSERALYGNFIINRSMSGKRPEVRILAEEKTSML